MDCILSFYVSYYRCFSHIQKKYIDKPPVTQYFQKCNRNRGRRSRGFSWEKCVLIVGSYGETSIREIAAVRGDFTNIATNSPYEGIGLLHGTTKIIHLHVRLLPLAPVKI